jgi:PAS domain S-box-containing protein
MLEEDRDYLSRYSQIVATKLEEKIRELEIARVRMEESESFVRKILETVDEGFIVVDRGYRIVSANRAFCLSAGMTEDQVVGRPCHEVSHHRDRPCHEAGEECVVKRTFETGAAQAGAHMHSSSTGEQYHVEIRAYPVTDASGNVVSAIETITDVTEKKKLEEQLRHAQKIEALGTLAGGVAHDFNNILNVIVGYGGIMEMRLPQDDPNAPYLREILAAAERATRLTESLLIFSRRQIPELKPVNINDLVNSMKKMVFRIIGEDIETDIHLAPEKMTVMGDYGQLEQVLMNFATNARDAMPEGGALTIETRLQEMDGAFIQRNGFGRPGRYALITVTDTGAGMDEQTRERIFEPFFTTKSEGKGTGLGLSIVYGIIRQHNGYVHCWTEPGRGTSFQVYLPLAGEAVPKKEEARTEVRGGSEMILIADDDENIRRLTRELLEQHGYAVIEAKDGADAISKFQDNRDRIQFVLLDVIMPRRSGKEVFAEMRAVRPDLKTLFMSGYTGDVIEGKKIAEEGLPLLHKPIRPRELLQKIREMLDGK